MRNTGRVLRGGNLRGSDFNNGKKRLTKAQRKALKYLSHPKKNIEPHPNLRGARRLNANCWAEVQDFKASYEALNGVTDPQGITDDCRNSYDAQNADVKCDPSNNGYNANSCNAAVDQFVTIRLGCLADSDYASSDAYSDYNQDPLAPSCIASPTPAPTSLTSPTAPASSAPTPSPTVMPTDSSSYESPPLLPLVAMIYLCLNLTCKSSVVRKVRKNCPSLRASVFCKSK